MVLFINDIKINIKKTGAAVNEAKYQTILSTFNSVDVSNWKGKVLLLYPNVKQARRVFDALEAEGCKVKSVKVIAENPKEFVKQVFNDFKEIKAGGGIVQNEKGKLLMIFRNGFWDFPKGKLEADETIMRCAEREVEEECGVKLLLSSEICKTRHTYAGSKNRMFKTTYWYNMKLVDDSEMAPQTKEGIEKVEWKTVAEADECLSDSFTSLKYLFKKFKNQ